MPINMSGEFHEHFLYPLSDWMYEVQNGDTRLGYEDWVEHKIDMEDNG